MAAVSALSSFRPRDFVYSPPHQRYEDPTTQTSVLMTKQQPSHQPPPYNNGYLPNGAIPTDPGAAGGPVLGANPSLPNQGRVLQAGATRVLCVADVRGNLSSLNDLARSARAECIIHTGDFGFYDERSLDRIAEKTLKHVAQYSPLISEDVRRQVTTSQPNTSIKDRIPRNQLPLSQLPLFLNNSLRFDVPVYTVWGACEDVQVLEKLRSKEYNVDKLHIIDEGHSRLLEIGGVKLRLLGLGGAVVMHKLFDNGEGRTTIAGGQGTMWTTLLQMGELVDTANRVYDPSETRVLVTHASPAREGLLNQLAVTLKVDFSISAGLHFRYGSSYNEFSVNPTLDHYRGKLAASKASFHDVWETVKSEVEPAVAENEAQQRSLQNAIEIVGKMPSVANGGNPFGGHAGPTTGQIDELAFKNMWNFNLADAAYGWLVLEVEGGRIGTEMKAQGFNFAHRGMKHPGLQADMIKPAAPSPTITGTSAVNGPLPTPQGQSRSTLPPMHVDAQQGQQNRQAQQTRQQPAQAPTQTRPTQSGPNPNPQHPPQTTQAQPPKTQATNTTRPIASAAPPSYNQATKSAPSQTAPTNTNTNQNTQPNIIGVKSSAAESKPNGVAASPVNEDNNASKVTSPPAEKPKPSIGIFIQNVNSEEEAKNLFSEDDRSKIQRMDRIGRAWAAIFSSPEEMQAVLRAQPADLKKQTPGKPNMKVFQDRNAGTSRPYNQGVGSWVSNSRGGAQQGGGYRSGGAASDSEGGRGGRGGFRGRGGRGGERGDRGGARGGRGGNFNKSAQGDSASTPPTTAPAAPAAVANGS